MGNNGYQTKENCRNPIGNGQLYSINAANFINKDGSEQRYFLKLRDPTLQLFETSNIYTSVPVR